MGINFEQLKKEAILKKTKEFISKHGMGEFSMEKLATYCGVAKGTFYNYFKSKNELLYCVIEYSVDRVWENLIKEDRKLKKPEERLFNIVKTTIEFFKKNRDILLLYAHEIKMAECIIPSPENEHGRFISNHLKRVTDLIEKIISQLGVKRKKQKISFAIHEQLVNFNKFYLLNPESEEEDDAEALFRFILAGLEALK